MNETGNNKPTILADSVRSLLATGGSKLVLFFAGVALARLLGPTDLGVLTLLITIGTFASSLSAFGIPQAATKFISEKDQVDPSVIVVSSSLLLLLSLVGSTILLLNRDWLAVELYSEASLVPLLPVITLFVLSSNALTFSQAILQGVGAIKTYNLVTILSSIVYLISVVGAAWMFGLAGAVWALVLNAAIGVALCLGFLIRRPKPLLQLTWNSNSWLTLKRILRYGGFLTAGGFVANAALWYAPTLLVQGHGFASLGYFRVANIVTSNLLLIPTAVAIPLFPALSASYTSDESRFTELARNSFCLVYLATLPLAVFCCLFSEELLTILVGSAYAHGWEIVFLMSVAGLLMAINSNAGSLFYGTGEMGHSMIINGIWGLLFAVAAWFLIPQLSERGLATAYVVSYTAMTAIQLLYQRHRWGIQFEGIGATILGTGLLFAGCYALKIFVHGMAFYVIAAAIVAGLVVFVLRIALAYPQIGSAVSMSLLGKLRVTDRG